MADAEREGPEDDGGGRLLRRLWAEAVGAQRAGPLDRAVTPLSPSALDAPIDAPSAGPPAGVPTPAPAAALPDAVPGYDLLREVSRGGQASVFAAVQRTTGRKVAVKVVSGGPFLSAASRARFEREVEVLARLDHPGIVAVVDRGRTSDGSLFLAMEYVEGEDLDACLARWRREGRGQADVLRLFADVADAVQEAHAQGVVHRDLKPSNVRVDTRGRPRVLDFGLAHLVGPEQGAAEAAAAASPLTVTGQVLGSLHWASPEQASGAASALTPASDVYSLGVVLYQALTGRFPYDVTGGVADAVANIRGATPARPERLADCPFGPVEAAAAGVVLKCLAKSPAERYGAAGEVAAELRSVLAGARTRSEEEGRARRRRRTRRAVLILAGAAAAAASAPWAVRLARAPAQVRVTPMPAFDNSVGMRMVRVPPGRAVIGSPENEAGRADDEGQRVVELAPYFIAATEVTRGQYRRVMGGLPAGVPADAAGDDDLPVDRVTWDEALEFCRRLSRAEGRGYRLPAEVEWEHACRAGTVGAFAGTGRLDDVAWHAGNAAGRLRPVATRSPNHWGLHDMHGNVAEWCLDDYYHNPPTPSDGAAASNAPPAANDLTSRRLPTRVVRGGDAAASPADCRSARRQAVWPHDAAQRLGFRVACDAASAR